MPNHLHAIIGFRKTTQTINTVIRNGKRFMAYEMITHLKETDKEEVLKNSGKA
jgi:hypothetical protein